MTQLDESDISDLSASIAGRAIVSSDSVYDGARRCFNAGVDRSPSLIVRCESTRDVIVSLDFASSFDLTVAVRGGGHHPAGHSVCSNGLVLDLSQMTTVRVDAGRRRAWIAGGAVWRDVDSATHRFGLVAPGGVVGSTGVAGLTLGGGLGHLDAQFGLACDNLMSAEVVTTSGDVIRAGPEDDRDLLWALRGGGGNFGIATTLELKLHPLRRVIGGRLTFSKRGIRNAIEWLRELGASSPRDLSCEAVLSVDPISGEPVMDVVPCYTGTRHSEVIERLSSAPGIVREDVHPQSHLAQQEIFKPTFGSHRTYWNSYFVEELSDQLIDDLLSGLCEAKYRSGQVLIESLHGAIGDKNEETSSVGFRAAAFNISVMQSWLDSNDDARYMFWARELCKVIEPWSRGIGYLNYIQDELNDHQMEQAYGVGIFARLKMLKARYDSHNVLCSNHNIVPSLGEY